MHLRIWYEDDGKFYQLLKNAVQEEMDVFAQRCHDRYEQVLLILHAYMYIMYVHYVCLYVHVRYVCLHVYSYGTHSAYSAIHLIYMKT